MGQDGAVLGEVEDVLQRDLGVGQGHVPIACGLFVLSVQEYHFRLRDLHQSLLEGGCLPHRVGLVKEGRQEPDGVGRCNGDAAEPSAHSGVLDGDGVLVGGQGGEEGAALEGGEHGGQALDGGVEGLLRGEVVEGGVGVLCHDPSRRTLGADLADGEHRVELHVRFPVAIPVDVAAVDQIQQGRPELLFADGHQLLQLVKGENVIFGHGGHDELQGTVAGEQVPEGLAVEFGGRRAALFQRQGTQRRIHRREWVAVCGSGRLKGSGDVGGNGGWRGRKCGCCWGRGHLVRVQLELSGVEGQADHPIQLLFQCLGLVRYGGVGEVEAVDYDVHKDGQSGHKIGVLQVAVQNVLGLLLIGTQGGGQVVHPPGDGQELPELSAAVVDLEPSVQGGQGGQLSGVRLGQCLGQGGLGGSPLLEHLDDRFHIFRVVQLALLNGAA